MIMDTFSRCLHTIHRMNLELGWHLSEAEQHTYATNMAKVVGEDCRGEKLKFAVSYYHDDHSLVEALQDEQNPYHVDAWQQVEQRVRQILVARHLDWSSDAQYEFEDLVQIALVELVRSLKGFRYACHFSTWAYKVITDSVRRTMRDSRARKRAIRPDSLDQSEGLRKNAYQIAAPQSEQPANLVDVRELRKLAIRLLQQHKDKRLHVVFYLYFVDDRSIEEIGEQICLHPSRTRTLLMQARLLVRDSPDIQEWRYTLGPSEFV
jgi:RNA polymerase sigma factor (sigma-70 family)